MPVDPSSLALSSAAAPRLPADVHLAIASQGQSPSDTIDTAESTQAYAAAASNVQLLQSLNTQGQLQAWNAADSNTQAMWAAAGYRPPAQPEHTGGGIFGSIEHVIGSVIGAAESVPGVKPMIQSQGQAFSAMKSLGGDALDALGSGLRFTQHVYRTGEMFNATHPGGLAGLGDNPVSNVLAGSGGSINAAVAIHKLSGNSDWADAWHATTHGDQTFDPNRVSQIQADNSLSDSELGLAKAAAGSSADVQNYLSAQLQGGMSPPDVTTLRDELSNPQSPQYEAMQAAVQQLKDAKMSFGRSLVPSSLWASNHALATLLSGTGDMMFDFADPFLLAGKVNKAVKVFRFGWDSFDRLQQVAQTKPAQAYMQSLVDILHSGGVAALIKRDPRLSPIATSLTQQRNAAGEITQEGIQSAEELTRSIVPKPISSEFQAAAEKQAQAQTQLGDVQAQLSDKIQAQVELNDLQVQIDKGLQVDESQLANLRARSLSGDPEAKKLLTQATSLAELARADTVEKMTDYVVNNTWALHVLSQPSQTIGVGTKAVLRLMGRSGATNMVPTLTPSGRAYLATKGLLTQSINWMADHGKPFSVLDEHGNPAIPLGDGGLVDAFGNLGDKLVLNPIGTTLRRTTTLLPNARSFDINSPKALTIVDRYARMYLTDAQASKIVNAWAAAGDIGTKRRVYLDMLGQTFAASGIAPDSELASHYISSIERAFVRQKFSINGYDNMPNGIGGVEANGLTEDQLTSEWGLPTFKELAANAKRDMFNKAVYGISNNPVANLVTAVWKPVQLLRGGFPIRTSLDEMMEASLREGPIALAKAALARQATQDVTGFHGPLTGLHPLARIASTLLRTLPQDAQDRVKDWSDLQAVTYAHRTVDWLRKASGEGFNKLAGTIPGVQDVENTIRRYNSTLLSHTMMGEISAQHGRMLGFSNNPEDVLDNMNDGMRKVVLLGREPGTAVRYTGDWKLYEQGTPGYMSTWMRMLDSLAESGVARHVMSNIGTDENTLRQTTADYLLSDEFKPHWNKAARSVNASDPALYGQPLTQRQLAQDWANQLMLHVKAFTHTSGPGVDEYGAPIDGLIPHLLEHGKSPDLSTLMRIEPRMRPFVVNGPEFAEMPFGGVSEVLREYANRGFSRIGNAMDFFARQLMYINAIHKADTQLRPAIERLLGKESPATEEVMQAIVHQRATNEVLPFIHNPQLRSQMNVLTQNLAPFQFAQEQFWKRWVRTFVHSPEAIREAQLAHHALGASGIVHTDDQGNEIFTYPATGFVQQAVSKGVDLLGLPSFLPVNNSFTGQLKMMAGGMDVQREFSPSFGPYVSFPLDALAQHVHSVIPFEQSVLGQGADRPLWEEIVPSWIARIFNATIANDQLTPSYASAEMKVIQDMEANHLTPGPTVDASGNVVPVTPGQRQDFMRRVSNWTRINMVLRAVFGFAAPASPQAAIGDTRIGKELADLSASGMDYSSALQELMKVDPDAYPYVVFMSESAGKEPLPSTKESEAMLNAHAQFFQNNPQAAGYFLPQTSSDSKFSQQAYKEQLDYGLRQRRMPKDFYDQIAASAAAPDYYATRDAHVARVANLHGPALQNENNSYEIWKQQYLAQHPIFADKLTSATAVADRNQTITGLEMALRDPHLPKTPQAKDIADLMATYDGHVQTTNVLAGLTTTRAVNQRKAETKDFIDWANQWLPQHSGALDVWNTLIRPSVEPVT